MRQKKIDLRTLEGEILRIEDDQVREALLSLLELVKAQQADIQHFWTYAEGVR